MFLDAFVSVLLSTANNVNSCERFSVSKTMMHTVFLLQGKGERGRRSKRDIVYWNKFDRPKAFLCLTYNAFNLVVVFVFEPMKLVYRERCNECFAVDIAEDDAFFGFDFYHRAICFDVFFCLSRFDTRFFSFMGRQLLVFLFVRCGSSRMYPLVPCAVASS